MVWKIPGVNAAKLIGDAFKSTGAPTCTLLKRSVGARTGGHGAGGNNPTTAPYTVRGIVSDFSLGYLQVRGDGGGAATVQAGDRKVLIFGDSLPKKTDGSGDPLISPEVGDQVTAEGRTFTIYYIDRDPLGATFDCAMR